MKHTVIWPQFFTATIYKWIPLLHSNEYKDIIISSLSFLTSHDRLILNAFVPIAIGMDNHIHIIWQPTQAFTLTQIQTSFMAQTAKEIKKKISIENPGLLQSLKVNKHDRAYQIWKREPLSIELFTEKVFIQKLNYVHENPVNAGLSLYPEDYKYSSAKFYAGGEDMFNMLTHYTGR